VPAEVFWVHGEHAGRENVGLFDVHKVAQADLHGRFWAPELPSGDCVLIPDFQRLHLVHDQMRIAHGARLTLPCGGDEVTLLFPRRRTEFGSIHGVVRSKCDGKPGARLHVALVDDRGEVVRETDTRADGRFEFPLLLSPAHLTVRVWGSRRLVGGQAPVALGPNKRLDMTIELDTLSPGPRATLSVRVGDTLGVPIAGAQVRAVLPDVSVARVETGFDGCATIDDLPARPVTVVAEAHGYWPAGASIAPGCIADPVEAEITLERAVRLRVHLRDAATGRPVRHANLFVRHAGGEQWTWGGVLPPPGESQRDFHDVSVRTGAVTVRAESPGHAPAEETIEVPATADDDVAVTVDLPLRA
jgi:5-hydroxyisourate hydrolase-like protein (transthyretin family)